VTDLFDQYQAESGQPIDREVVQQVFDVTAGQPGLVGWFGELLTEKYNPGADKPIMFWSCSAVRMCRFRWMPTGVPICI
jgi:hypothetical protein